MEQRARPLEQELALVLVLAQAPGHRNQAAKDQSDGPEQIPMMTTEPTKMRPPMRPLRLSDTLVSLKTLPANQAAVQ
jgi:hypothetical protein